MSSAPLDAKNWKTMMLAGDVQPALGRQCRELLAKLHAMPVPDFLGDDQLFRQQRIKPYFEFILDRHPEVRPIIVQLNSRHECVTHGDYTPKNFLGAGDTLILLDYEVAHLGWPQFDIASIVNHLTLKTFYLPAHREALWDTAQQFLGILNPRDGWLQCLGGLMLARVDGKSPVEYLREEDKPRIRNAAKRLLRGDFASYEAFHTGAF